MNHPMFCYQCEQTAGCSGCVGKAGVCGKSAAVANLQDQLTGALIGLARAADTNTPTTSTHRAVIEGLFTTLTNVNFNEETVCRQIDIVRREKAALTPNCSACASPCGRTDEYDMSNLWEADEDIRSLKSLILFGLRGMAAYAYHAMVLGYTDEEVNRFFYEGLFAIGEDWGMEELLPMVMKVGQVNLKCMALLDKANTETYGHPVPTTVPLTVEKGPFIVITGHDLRDLQLLLEQTEGNRNEKKSNVGDTDTIASAEQNMYTAAGVNSLLFNNEKASANALALSIKADQAITYGIVKSVGDAINRFIQSQSYGKNFRIEFLDCSQFNRKELGDAYLKAASYGLPTISMYAASQGLGQAELDSMSFLEKTVLGLQDMFKPLVSSTQMSSLDVEKKGATDQGGAPTKDVGDLTDSGEQTSEQKDDWG